MITCKARIGGHLVIKKTKHKKMIKVNYDTETRLVTGYYPDSINYASIPEPYIEISNEQHQEALGKQMCVVDGFFQEYITPDNVLLEEGKKSKIAQLKTNKDNVLNGFVLITINSYPFNIYKDKLEVLAARIYYLTYNNLTSSNWTDNNNFRRELTLEQFEELYSRSRNHYTVLDDNAYTLYIELKNEIDAISIDGEYFNENQEPISALQALENININFE